MTTVEVKLRLANDVLVYLQREARERKITLDKVVSQEVQRIVASLLPPTNDENDERL